MAIATNHSPKGGKTVSAFQVAIPVRPIHKISNAFSNSINRRNDNNNRVFCPTTTSTRLFDSEVMQADDLKLSEDLLPQNGANHTTNIPSNGIDKEATTTVLMTENPQPIPTEPIPTAAGGYLHTAESRAKISQANKGKTPWNKGKTRSAETKARIAEGVRRKNRERFLEKLKAMNMTEAEYDLNKKEERRKRDAERRQRRTANGGYRPTEETKRKLSETIKAKWANGEMKHRQPVDLSKVRRGFTHSEETRAKISASLRKRWATDPEYREAMVNKTVQHNSSDETKRKISETLKAKWQDPEFRQEMMDKMKNRKAASSHRSEEHRRRISEAMKRKWQNAEYRNKTRSGILLHQEKMAALRPPKPPKKKKAPRKAAASRKKTFKIAQVTPRGAPLELDEFGNPIPGSGIKVRKIKRKVMKKKATTSNSSEKKKATTPKKKAKRKKKSKEPDGSINRLRDERRDLYDLLYGDEEVKQNDNEYGGTVREEKSSGLAAMLNLEDDDLDVFDPYGLEDF